LAPNVESATTTHAAIPCIVLNPGDESMKPYPLLLLLLLLKAFPLSATGMAQCTLPATAAFAS
jgi:hypothetical protein